MGFGCDCGCVRAVQRESEATLLNRIDCGTWREQNVRSPVWSLLDEGSSERSASPSGALEKIAWTF